MESIFHEKQEGSLCAQHCLNNLLQGEYFSPVELSSIAMQLDEQERMRMAEGGLTSEEYRTFMQQPSGNMDDSGFFSIQVISDALRVWGLELILFNSPEYQNLGIDPINERAFICNYKEHWFTVRKLGKQWFNLNSLLTGPELISDTYLALFLAQLQQEGWRRARRPWRRTPCLRDPSRWTRTRRTCRKPSPSAVSRSTWRTKRRIYAGRFSSACKADIKVTSPSPGRPLFPNHPSLDRSRPKSCGGGGRCTSRSSSRTTTTSRDSRPRRRTRTPVTR
ncbi:ataxin-3 isoform X3 [Spea bombifrons]|uniref:ataxin-3 isoform X3 n=1 Tax=Spea bombifrons TaxID=233779 RepID=UPI00234A091D|nr:ataxin-3 isoform X3 [Spea bombifrons]